MSPLAARILSFDSSFPGDGDYALPAKEWAHLVALAKGETPKPYRVAIVACSAAKLTGTHPAKDLYRGQLFLLARQLAEAKANTWLILSARHGLVGPHDELAAYDLSIEDAAPTWGQCVADLLSLALTNIAPEQVLCLAPESYVSKLPVGFAKGWVRPLKGKGIGQQKAELKRLLGVAS